jgi:ABC-type multidrug transport system fused ATPase/permease subunit
VVGVKQLQYLRTLLGFAFSENPLLYVSVVVSVLSVIFELAAMISLLPLASIAAGQAVPDGAFMVRAVDALGLKPDARTLVLVFVALFALRIVSQLAGQGLTLLISKRLLAQLATRAFSSLVCAVPLKQVEKGSIGSYITLVGDESFRASNLVVFLNQFVALALLALLYYGAVMAHAPLVALGVAVFLLISFVTMFESFRVSHRLGHRQVEQSQAASSLFIDALNGLRSVRAFSAEAYVSLSYRTQMLHYMRTLFSIDFISLLTRLVPALLLLGGVALVAAWPAVSTSLRMDFASVVTIVIFLMRFFPVVGQTLGVALRVIADARAGRDVTHLITGYDDAPAPASGTAAPLEQIRAVEVLGAGFSHDPDKRVLEAVSLQLSRGRSYALVGVSGSGKSTLLDLLMGFYPMDDGELLINGAPITHPYLAQLRSRILLVSQDTAIFNDTVSNNLCFGGDAPQDEIERACRVACIDEFIASLPQGYATPLSYRGSNLSGGQKQRIGIARAVLRRPDVLLLDESTSALDANTRERVVDNLLKEFGDRIVLFVTHDAFVMARVSQILDMAAINRAPLPVSAEQARASSSARRAQ